ncbi:hypothetical protein VSH64_36025 [Amycolatopsis rhabdoformis]|uniref:Uncharacterized protein n=1 Tax=Amycolatopsis rhabdoformis TaxID=1448059 RepID=A0ABZ1I220_9PSEU|nr:hypothetical protein [Amycolatopsis rhabdoformis]WSE28209.1 hypothetical protein VSH64_36025 [Amycolatopsis rhabdoformis]
MRNLTISCAVAGLAAIGIVGLSPSASAAQRDVWAGYHPTTVLRTESSSDAATSSNAKFSPQENAPTCIEVTNEDEGTFSTTIYLINECTTTERIRLIMDRGGDSDCETMFLHSGWQFTSDGVDPTLNHIELC